VIGEATPVAETMLAHALRDGRPLGAEYPLIFGEGAPGRLVTVEEEGVPVAGCATLARDVLAPPGRLRLGLIGSVGTDEVHRGRGLASAALKEAQRELADQGCAIALLWAEDADFYDRRGWSPIGSEVDHLIVPELAPLLPERPGVRVANAGDFDVIHDLYCAHTSRVERGREESRALLACPGTSTLVLETDGMLVAYACLGRGEDLHGAVHEWGGGPLDVLALVRRHLEGSPQPLALMSPRDEQGVHRYLAVAGIAGAVGILGMGKLISTEAAARTLEPLVGPEGCVTAIEAGVALDGPEGRAELDELQTLLLLAAPRGLRDVAEAAAELTGLDLGALPLNPFVWGLDSI